MRDGLPVTELVTRARDGDQRAWDALVDRYAPLVWSICRRHGLGHADAEDAAQTVWLHLVGQLGRLREPDALPGWLVTTTRRACLQARDKARRTGTPAPLPDAAGLGQDRLMAASYCSTALAAECSGILLAQADLVVAPPPG